MKPQMEIQTEKYCSSCRKKKPIAEFAVGPSLERYATCRYHLDAPDAMFITWFDFMNLMQTVKTEEQPISMDYCILSNYLPIDWMRRVAYKGESEEQSYRSLAAKLMEFIYENLGIQGSFREGLFAANHWRCTYWCRQRIERIRRKSMRVEKAYRTSNSRTPKLDCQGYVAIHVYTYNIRIVVNHRTHHEPRYSYKAWTLMYELANDESSSYQKPCELLAKLHSLLEEEGDSTCVTLKTFNSILKTANKKKLVGAEEKAGNYITKHAK